MIVMVWISLIILFVCSHYYISLLQGQIFFQLRTSTTLSTQCTKLKNRTSFFSTSLLSSWLLHYTLCTWFQSFTGRPPRDISVMFATQQAGISNIIQWSPPWNSQRGKVLQLFSFPVSFEISLLIFTSAQHNTLSAFCRDWDACMCCIRVCFVVRCNLSSNFCCDNSQP